MIIIIINSRVQSYQTLFVLGLSLGPALPKNPIFIITLFLSCLPFQSCPYKLIFVLHKDVLFHWCQMIMDTQQSFYCELGQLLQQKQTFKLSQGVCSLQPHSLELKVCLLHENFSVFKIKFFVKDKKLLENTFFLQFSH